MNYYQDLDTDEEDAYREAKTDKASAAKWLLELRSVSVNMKKS